LGEKPGDERYFQPPEKMTEPVYQNGMKPRIEQKLQVSDGGVVSVYGLDILYNGEHFRTSVFWLSIWLPCQTDSHSPVKGVLRR
jgi:hypothetical protein